MMIHSSASKKVKIEKKSMLVIHGEGWKFPMIIIMFFLSLLSLFLCWKKVISANVLYVDPR